MLNQIRAKDETIATMVKKNIHLMQENTRLKAGEMFNSQIHHIAASGEVDISG